MKNNANSELNIRKSEQRYVARVSLKFYKKLANKENRRNAKAEIAYALAA